MAAGDIKWFAKALHDLGDEIHDLASDTLKLGIITIATVPTVADTAPRWQSTGGDPDYSATKVSEGGGWTEPVSLTTVTWTVVTGVPILRADTVTITANAGGFTNGRYGIIYNDTAAAKQCLGYIDFGENVSIVSANYVIDWYGATNDILKLTQS